MKLNFSLLTFAMVLFISSAAHSQKALEKEWSKKLKAVKPLEYMALIEERDHLQKEVADCGTSKAEIKNEAESKNAEIEKLKADLAAAKSSLDSIKAGGSNSNAVAVSSGGAGTTPEKSLSLKGVVFKVQIGAFRNKDLTKYFDNHKNFTGEVDEDGSKKYTICVFSDYWEADKFKKYLRDMGVKDAWIVSYKDGRRVNIKDALEGTL